jgi:hypothetical protein
MYLGITVVVVLHRELVQLVDEVVGGVGIHVPPGVDEVRACLSMSGCCSNLTVHVLTIIVDAELNQLKALWPGLSQIWQIG